MSLSLPLRFIYVCLLSRLCWACLLPELLYGWEGRGCSLVGEQGLRSGGT